MTTKRKTWAQAYRPITDEELDSLLFIIDVDEWVSWAQQHRAPLALYFNAHAEE